MKAKWIPVAIFGIAGIAAAIAQYLRHKDAKNRIVVKDSLLLSRTGNGHVFQEEMVEDLPIAAQKYLLASIKTGSRTFTSAFIQMGGRFSMDPSVKSFPMKATELISVNNGFLWDAEIKMGPARFHGYDYCYKGNAKQSFFINNVFPFIREQPNVDLNLSALGRLAMEAIWLPACFLPVYGAKWEHISSRSARVTRPFMGVNATLTITIQKNGLPESVSMERWGNENLLKKWKWMSFGADVLETGEFKVCRVPKVMRAGWGYGTDNFKPFFTAEIENISYF